MTTQTQTLNLELNQSQNYPLTLELESGKLESLKLSGQIEGSGNIKIYLDELLILDSDNLEASNNKSESSKQNSKNSFLTGLAVDETSQTSEPANTSEPTSESQTSSSEEITQEEALKEESSPSQEPLSSEVTEEPALPSSEVTEEPALPSSEVTEEPVSKEKNPKKKIDGLDNQTTKPAKFSITGQAVTEEAGYSKKSLFNLIIEFLKKIPSTITGRAVTTEETPEEIELIIEDNAMDYEIEYYTQAPQSFEENISPAKKQITISGPDELNYTDILAYTYLPTEAPVEAVKLYHIANGSREEVQTYLYDSNNNSLVDYVEWIVSHLSNQTYELEITIINVKSHPMVGKNWTVEFNTTGKANLTITAFNGTNWSNTEEIYDLKFLEIKCGQEILEYNWTDNGPENSSVFIPDYECNKTAYETSKVLTTGIHTIEFDFGGIKAYAYITATNLSIALSGFINGYNSSLWLKTYPQSHTGYDAYDLPSSPPPSNYSEFYSNITGYKLSIDSWNNTANPRKVNLTYYITSAQTGTINFYWPSLQGAEYYGNFSYYEADSTYTSLVATRDMRAYTSYSDSITAESNLYIQVTINNDSAPPYFTNIANNKRLNHRIEVISGIMRQDSAYLLKEFFKKKR